MTAFTLSASAIRRARPPAPVPHREPLGRLALMLALTRNPLTVWNDRHFREAIVQRKGPLGFGTVISDPAAIRHVFVDNAANYRKDDLQLRILSPGLGDGLLTAEGDVWRRTRRTLAPLFTPRQVAAFARPMRTTIDAFVDGLVSKAGREPVAVDREMTTLTFEVLAATLFTGALPRGPEAFARAIDLYFAALGRVDPLDLLGAPAFIPRLGPIRARPALDFFEREVIDIVARRKALAATDPAAVPRDILTLLLEAQDPETGVGLTEAEVGANIVTFIAAGHETTANALAWAMFLVQTDPSVRDRLEAEADQVLPDPGEDADLVARLPVARAVVEEAMRLYPPVATMTRAAIEDDEVLGRPIPKGSLVVVSPYVLHRHRRLWPEPDLFRPWRFLSPAREALDRFQYLPFGLGPRICIGAGFALTEATLALAMLARRLRWKLKPGHTVMPRQRITLRPGSGLPMLLERR
jgi:cytochrome P450